MIIDNQPHEGYLAHPAIGSSLAKLANKSMQLFLDACTGVYQVPTRPSLQIGTLVHMMVLEPERFAKFVKSIGPVNPRTNKPYGRDTEAFTKWQADNPDVIMVDQWMHSAINRMPREIADMFVGGIAERSVYTTCKVTGLNIKCRPDYMQSNSIIDLKTIDSIDYIERAIARYGYWFSSGWYKRVMLNETGEKHRHAFVFMEKQSPYRWRHVTLDASYMMHANHMVSQTLGKIALAQETGDYSDHDELKMMVSLPDYMQEDDDDAL